MMIRLRDGLYAGEIREFPSHIALELIRQGRAENPYAEPAPQRIEVVPPIGVLNQNRAIEQDVEAARTRRKGRR
jgi:hypothetical protein